MSAATVRHAGRTWNLGPEVVLTVGRGSSCDVRLPDDVYISRHAASLRVVDGQVLVRNESGTKAVALRPPRGEDRVLEPGAGMTSGGWRSFDLVVTGRAGVASVVEVDAAGLFPVLDDGLDGLDGGPDGVGGRAGGPVATASPATVRSPVELTGAQRRVLTAMAAPLLSHRGARAVPATYAQVGRRLGLQPAYVRNVVKALRDELTGHGVPGLGRDEVGTGDERPDDRTEDFRSPLARWAVRNGWVTAHDVAVLPAEPT